MSATCAFAIMLYNKNKENDKSPLALADYFCTISSRRVQERFAALTDNDDKKANLLAKQMSIMILDGLKTESSGSGLMSEKRERPFIGIQLAFFSRRGKKRRRDREK